MSKLDVDNIITTSNLFEVVNAVKQKVGYEFQAPLDDATQTEITCKEIRKKIQEIQTND